MKVDLVNIEKNHDHVRFESISRKTSHRIRGHGYLKRKCHDLRSSRMRIIQMNIIHVNNSYFVYSCEMPVCLKSAVHKSKSG
jgi:hypothetical protein